MHSEALVTDRDTLQSAARNLITRGFAYVPYDTEVSRQLQEFFQNFCDSKSKEERAQWTFEVERRPDGIYDPDDGFYESSGKDSKDCKRRLHFREGDTGLCRLLLERGITPSSDERAFLTACEDAFWEQSEIVLELVEAIDQVGRYTFSLFCELSDAFHEPIATSRSVLRLLDYPPQVNEQLARLHVDRSALTFHAGGSGGDLFFRNARGEYESISPKEGEALVFWGHKATLLAEENACSIDALPHGSRGKIGERRQAVVSFWHINKEVWDAPEIKT